MDVDRPSVLGNIVVQVDIKDLFVEPLLRRLGCATKLFHHACEELKKTHQHPIVLKACTPMPEAAAIECFSRWGFKITNITNTDLDQRLTWSRTI